MFKTLVAATYGISCIKYTKILRESTVFKVQDLLPRERGRSERDDTHFFMQYAIILQVLDKTFKVIFFFLNDIFLNNILRCPFSQLTLPPKTQLLSIRTTYLPSPFQNNQLVNQTGRN